MSVYSNINLLADVIQIDENYTQQTIFVVLNAKLLDTVFVQLNLFDKSLACTEFADIMAYSLQCLSAVNKRNLEVT